MVPVLHLANVYIADVYPELQEFRVVPRVSEVLASFELQLDELNDEEA